MTLWKNWLENCIDGNRASFHLEVWLYFIMHGNPCPVSTDLHHWPFQEIWGRLRNNARSKITFISKYLRNTSCHIFIFYKNEQADKSCVRFQDKLCTEKGAVDITHYLSCGVTYVYKCWLYAEIMKKNRKRGIRYMQRNLSPVLRFTMGLENNRKYTYDLFVKHPVIRGWGQGIMIKV